MRQVATGKVIRMLALKVVRWQKHQNQSGVAAATLLMGISYIKDGHEVILEAGTSLVVDLDRGIGCIEVDHFDVFPGEYRLDAVN